MKLVFCWILIAWMAATATAHRKPCLHPEPKRDGQFCRNPTVLQPLCQGRSCRGAQDGTGICTVVAHALLREFEDFDAVFLHEGLCQEGLESGTLTREDVDAVLPYNQELVALNINGSDLLAALEHGLDLNHFHNMYDSYPTIAGIRFHVNLKTPYGNRISKAQILGDNCEWKPLKLRETYRILTNEALANGYYDYPFFTRASRDRTWERTKFTVSDTFWHHAQSICTVRDPFPRPPVLTPPTRSTRQGPQKTNLSACPATHS